MQKSEKRLNIPLSILDLVMVNEDGSPGQSMQNSLDLARHAECWGYRRYWLAEHHNIRGIASSATSVLVGFIAGGTSSIRVGSGGVMLPNHSPLVIAEQFGTLESLYPGRIDLGVGRAPGTDIVTAMALRRDIEESEEDFPFAVKELIDYFNIKKINEHVRAIPGEGLKIPVWLLGSSTFSANLSAELGLPFAFASHFSPIYLEQAIALYKKRFRPSSTLKEPYAIAAINVVAADTDEEAHRLFTSVQLRTLGLIRGQHTLLKPPVDDVDRLWDKSERLAVEERLKYSFVGSPYTIKKSLDSFLNKIHVDEIMSVSHIYVHISRLRSFEILSML